MQTRRGQSIEDASMRVIEEEVGPHGYGALEWPIVRRVIHTTADFDFAGRNAVLFSGNAVRYGVAALRRGCSIVADVNGVLGGMNKQNPRAYGNEVVCRISDRGVAEAAARGGKTRAQAAMGASAAQISGGIVAVGNAPTALLEVLDMARRGAARPALVIGVPVGFINAAESKEELVSSGAAEYISNRGRKGGSAVAAAIINALYKLAAG